MTLGQWIQNETRLIDNVEIVIVFLPLLKNEWVILKAWSGLPIDFMASSEAGRYAVVKAEAAAGGGQGPPLQGLNVQPQLAAKVNWAN